MLEASCVTVCLSSLELYQEPQQAMSTDYKHKSGQKGKQEE
uniref:Uncharacterized protein n=1 Tax=Setaria italica TaxID=4555 RepID=K3ZFP4_SETIT